MTTKPVLIAGGGIGGLGAALALSKKGFASHVVEQASEFKEIGAGIQLGPNVFRMFDRLGLTEAILHWAAIPRALVMMDALDATEVTRVPLGDGFIHRFGGPYAVIHRADLQKVIYDACRKSDLITLTAGTKVTGFEDKGDRVVARLSGGSALEGAALIGCDGLWSTIRPHIVGDGKPRVSGHIAYRAVLPMAEVPHELRRKEVILWAGPKTHLVHYPLRRGELMNLVAVFHSDRYEEGWDTYGDPGELHEKFRASCAEVQTMLGKIEAWRMWVLCDREPVRHWSRGRVTLLGDAAHPMLQYLAQGANMALEDAVCLADLLEANQGDPAPAFLEYEAQRYLRTGRVQLTARFYGDVYHAAGVARELRKEMLSGGDPEARREGMAWLYDGP
jgi:salicylate hydroxylase